MSQTSYMGVAFTAEQNKILLDDLAAIDNASSQLAVWQAKFNTANADYNNAVNRNCGERKIGRIKEYDDCMSSRQSQMEKAQSDASSAQANINSWTSNLATANKNYNDDLTAIQNSIKLQIQAQVANTSASTQNAQNQLTLQQNDPRVLLQKSEAEAAAKIKAMELQATLDKQKRDSNIKIIGFVAVSIVVVLVGWYVIKKLL